MDIGNNIVEINVISEDDMASKIYKINVYRKSKKETREYNEMQEENEQKVQEILNEQTEEENYHVEKTNVMVSYYKSNNELIKCGVLISILLIIVITLIIRNKLKENLDYILKSKNNGK